MPVDNLTAQSECLTSKHSSINPMFQCSNVPTPVLDSRPHLSPRINLMSKHFANLKKYYKAFKYIYI
jgi:hypothetical protein